MAETTGPNTNKSSPEHFNNGSNEANMDRHDHDPASWTLEDYRPLHPELYEPDPSRFLTSSFMDAVKQNTEEGFRKITSEPVPGIYTFKMFRPEFSQLLMAEVEKYEKWVAITQHKITRPNSMNKYGAILDQLGFYPMLQNLMTSFISPMSAVFFNHILAGATLDSHHGFVVEYGEARDRDLGFHVDDSEITLNVCLGKRFTGGALFFRGVRCDKHVDGRAYPEEILEYSHVPGVAVLHAGRHRHGVKAITGGNRMNLILWCRSSELRETNQNDNDCFSWCGECSRSKQRRM